VAKDAPILAAAIDARCDWLVTGDRRDFGHLFGSNQRSVLVVSPSEALRRLIDQLQIGG
jgi:predicted nucleic acid-binding protein